MKPILLILVGVSGSGKTFYAKQLLEQDKNFIRLSRDDLKITLTGNLKDFYFRKDSKVLENYITNTIEQSIFKLLKEGFNIVLDNTHLKRRYIKRLVNLYKDYADVQFKYFDCELEVIKKRVLERDYSSLLSLHNLTADDILNGTNYSVEHEYFLKSIKHLDKQYQEYGNQI